MDWKEQVPIFIVGLVAIVAIFVMVALLNPQNKGQAFSVTPVGGGGVYGVGNVFNVMSSLGCELVDNKLVGCNLEDPRLVNVLGGIPSCNAATQECVLPNGQHVRFGGLNVVQNPVQPKVVCWNSLSDHVQSCVRQKLGGLPIPSTANICVRTTRDPSICETVDCSECAMLFSQALNDAHLTVSLTS